MRLQLFSGRVVELRVVDAEAVTRARGSSLAAARQLLQGPVGIFEDGRCLDVDSLPLADFHLLRAVATHEGWLSEQAVALTCRNCGGTLLHRACRDLPLGPFVEHTLNDDELDRTLDLSLGHEVSGLGAVHLEARTLAQALPLHEAVERGELAIDARLVEAMGIAAVDDVTEPARIAERLEASSDEACGAVTDLFLRAHYPPRLFSMARCASCGARHDVDAPYVREFEPSPAGHSHSNEQASNQQAVLEFDAFDDRARALAAELVPADEGIAVVVDGGVAPCDDGGEPLLGSYVPATLGSDMSPSRQAEISVFYRTFRAIWEEEGPYDWDAELRETFEHELAHHRAYLAGDDPVDEEERRAIDHEAELVHGKRALIRVEAQALRGDVAQFLRRTWLVWVLVAGASLVGILTRR